MSMFGSSAFGGGGGGFGGGFGQQNKPAGSVFGSGSTGFGGGNTGGTGFGSGTPNAFGSPSTTSAFGQPAAQTGGFGSPSTNSAFGQPSTGGAFGQPAQSTGAFGSTGGGFGQPAAGGFGTPANQTGGAFGSGTAQNTTSAFGGGGGFGSGTGGGFGSNTNANTGTSGMFGAPKPFGTPASTATTGGGMFGTANTNSTGGAFGTNNANSGAAGMFGAGAPGAAGQMTQGTVNPPFSPLVEVEPNTSNKVAYNTISFMPAYRNYSLEELRMQDYMQGRRYGATNTFGQNTGFGATSGTSGGFGSAQPSSAPGAFGSTQNSSTGGLFGAATSTQPSSGFGAPAASTGGLFGNKPATTGGFGGGFGSTTPAATGGFGSTPGGFGSTAASGTGGFGQAAQNKPAGFGGGFGTPSTGTGFGAQTSTAGGFGQPTSAPGGFGQPAQQQQSTGGFGTPFGGAAAQPQQQQSAGLFGNGFGQNKPATGFGAPVSTGFGNTGAGGFGSTGTTGGFGQPAQQQQNTGGAFGQPASQPGATGGLFGQPQINTSSVFGQPQQQAQQNTGGLFGNQQSTTSTPAGGLFGNQPAKPGGLFGNTQASSNTGGLFGNQQQPQQQSTGFGGLSGFSQPVQQQPGGLFGNSMATSQQQQPNQFATSINDSPYGNSSLMNSLGGNLNASLGPIATPLGSSQTKKAAMIPHYKIAPRQSTFSPRASTNFTRSASPFSPAASMAGNGAMSRSISANKLSLFDNDESILSSGSFTPNGMRLKSLKKLAIDKNLRDVNLFGEDAGPRTRLENLGSPKVNNTPKSILRKSVSFDIAGDTQEDDPFTSALSSGPEPSAPELGYLRSPRRTSMNGSNGSNGFAESQPSPKAEAPPVTREVTKPKESGTYWMLPSLEKLQTMTEEQLSKVKNFQVGRRGFGNVEFLVPVDLSGVPCELRDIPGTVVTFVPKICTVYPPGLDKPPRGKGLNVPAQITLEDCFPISPDERSKITDPAHPRVERHKRRLQSVKDTKYVHYDAETGTWTFKVDHFTAYGLIDDEDDDDEMDYEGSSILSSVPPSAQGETPTPRQAVQSSLLLSDDSIISSENDESSIMNDTFEFKTRTRPPRVRDAFPGSFSTEEEDSIVQYDDEETIEDENSFLGHGSVGSISEADEPAEPNSDEMEDEGEATIIVDTDVDMSHSFAHDGDGTNTATPTKNSFSLPTPRKLALGADWTEQLTNTISPAKKRFGGVRFASPGPEKTTDLASPTRQFTSDTSAEYSLLDLANDLYGSPARGKGETPVSRIRKRSLFESPAPGSNQRKPASVLPKQLAAPPTKFEKFKYDELPIEDQQWRKEVRPAWTSDGRIVFAGNLEGLGADRRFDGRSLRVAKLNYGSQACIEKTLERQLEASTVQSDEDGVPFITPNKGLQFQDFAKVSWSQDPEDQHEKGTWRLAGILFDDIAPLPQTAVPGTKAVEYVTEKIRKEALTKFLQEVIEPLADATAESASSLEEIAFAHLTAHRIESACAALVEAGDLRLATLLPMIGGDPGFRDMIRKQIEVWQTKGMLAEISKPIRAIYEVLSGEVGLSHGVNEGAAEDRVEDFWISQYFGLDWRRSFAMKLWYELYEHQPIRIAVEEYAVDLEKFPVQTPHPTPWFAQEDDSIDLTDIHWGLLRLYADPTLSLDSILDSPSTSTDSLSLRLTWQLATLFSEKRIRSFANDIASPDGALVIDRLTVDFAAELEHQGFWQWSAFVLLHLPDLDAREVSVRDMISRHIEDLASSDALTEFLEKRLLIPSTWLYEARALFARSTGDHFLEADYLLAANRWDDAHKTIIRRVAPQAVIAGGSRDLQALKEVIEKFENADDVRQWRKGAQVYLDFIELKELLNGAGNRNTDGQVNGEQPKTNGLPKNNTPQEKAKRLLRGLKECERDEFLQQVAVREMAQVVGGWVLKHANLVNDSAKVLDLPLSEDQYLRETVNLSLQYYRAKLQTVK